MKRILLVGAALAALSTAAFAADVPASIVEPVAVDGDWSGLYVGIQGGFAFGNVNFDFAIDPVGTEFDADGFAIGLYAGSNYQFGSWVVGVDSSISFVDIDDEGGFTSGPLAASFETQINFMSTTRGRIGFAFDNWLLFAAGGVAVAEVETRFSDVPGGMDASDDHFHIGWTVGAGVETKFSENWSARVEYLFVDLGEDDYSYTNNGGSTLTGTTDVNAHIVRGGLAYHF